jgi:hypothetical protein
VLIAKRLNSPLSRSYEYDTNLSLVVYRLNRCSKSNPEEMYPYLRMLELANGWMN